jgi:hypothetical protein
VEERQEFVGLTDRELVGVPMSFEEWKLELARREKRWGPMFLRVDAVEVLAGRDRDGEAAARLRRAYDGAAARPRRTEE